MHSGNIENKFFDLRDEKKGKKKAYLVAGDKGLAGGYNHNMIKIVEEHLRGDRKCSFFVAGQCRQEIFLRRNIMYNGDLITLYKTQQYIGQGK